MDFGAQMKICVFGLWHLGSVTAACLASGGHEVIGLDFDEQVIKNLNRGKPPLFEPHLEDLIKEGLAQRKLSFTANIKQALQNAQVIWVTYDTPVDEDDNANVEFVTENVTRLFPDLESGQQILISSQLPVGTTHTLEEKFKQIKPNQPISFSYSPENLRLGKAISVFTNPDRVVIGTRNAENKKILSELLLPFTIQIEWMSVESAEMTKHALNAFLATSVTFINEIAVICEQVGADAKEVERGLKSESRIGPKAYLAPGGAFAGGTLARDISFLTKLSAQHNVPVQLFPAIKVSNDIHKNWIRRRLAQLFDTFQGKTIAVWGLTYKPGTDTLRRSNAIELCQWLLEQGVHIQAHDPVVKQLPTDMKKVELFMSALDAVHNVDALVISTEWPEYLALDMQTVISKMNAPLILDANRFLSKNVESLNMIKYISVGKYVK